MSFDSGEPRATHYSGGYVNRDVISPGATPKWRDVSGALLNDEGVALGTFGAVSSATVVTRTNPANYDAAPYDSLDTHLSAIDNALGAAQRSAYVETTSRNADVSGPVVYTSATSVKAGEQTIGEALFLFDGNQESTIGFNSGGADAAIRVSCVKQDGTVFHDVLYASSGTPAVSAVMPATLAVEAQISVYNTTGDVFVALDIDAVGENELTVEPGSYIHYRTVQPPA